MKNILAISGLALLSFGSMTMLSANKHEHHSTEQSRRCAYIKKDGYQCKNYAQENSIYCWNHNPLRY